MSPDTFEIGGVPAEDLAQEYGTPLYAYDETVIRNRFGDLRKSVKYPESRIHYSCKANNNPEIIKLLKESGVAGIDAVSVGEVKLALHLGFRPEQVSITNPALSESDMKWCHDRGVRVKIDSISQLKTWSKFSDESWLRINPGEGYGHHEHVVTGGAKSKFGIYLNEIEEAASVSKVVGLHQHIGSDILDVRGFLSTVGVLYETAGRFDGLRELNVGGGLGIPYQPGQESLDVGEFGARLSESFEEFCDGYGRRLALSLEPGRYFVAESGCLLCRVNAVKQSLDRKFVVVDTGFNHLIRPILYNSYHHVVNASNPTDEKERVWVGGNICESGDLLTEEREISRPRIGDVLAILNAGAYGYSMASHYTLQELPAEVMVSNGSHRLIRERSGLYSFNGFNSISNRGRE